MSIIALFFVDASLVFVVMTLIFAVIEGIIEK